MTIERLGVLGAGAHAREIASFMDPSPEIFWAVSNTYRDYQDNHQVDICSPPPEILEVAFVAGVGAPGLRRKLVRSWPGTNFTKIVAKSAYVGPTCEIGAGAVVGPGAILTTNVLVGRHSHINIGATISHDVRLGDFVTICPGATICGRAVIDDGVFIGAGACVVNGARIASGVVIGAGSTVVRDVLTKNAVVVGTPAQTVSIMQDWLDAI